MKLNRILFPTIRRSVQERTHIPTLGILPPNRPAIYGGTLRKGRRVQERVLSSEQYKQYLVQKYLGTQGQAQVQVEKVIALDALEENIPGIKELANKLNIETPEELLEFYKYSRELAKQYEEKFRSWIQNPRSNIVLEDQPLKKLYDNLLEEVLKSAPANFWGTRKTIIHNNVSYIIPESDFRKIPARLAGSAASQLRKTQYELNEADERLIKCLGLTNIENYIPVNIYPDNSNHRFYILRRIVAKQNRDSIHNLILNTQLNNKKLSCQLENRGILYFRQLHEQFPVEEQLILAITTIQSIGNKKAKILVDEMKARGYYKEKTLTTS